ncbi:MAG: hypothetical protein ACYDC1_04980 [Limisphaerales bacterium]
MTRTLPPVGPSRRRESWLGRTCDLWMLCLALQAAAADESNPALKLFQQFSNGQMPIEEAIVYRRIGGSFTNESWLRFGFQTNTWYGQWVKPDPANAGQFVPVDSRMQGASHSHFWLFSDDNIHLVPLDNAKDSTPWEFCKISWSMIRQALSFGVPMPHDGVGGIHWDGPRFESRTITEFDQTWTPLETNVVRGVLVLGPDGRPRSTEYTAKDQRLNSVVTYEYAPDSQGLPRVFTETKVNGDSTWRFEFLALKMGAVDLSQTDGYVPSLFADMTLPRKTAVWSHEKVWYVEGDELKPGFGFEPYRPPNSSAPWVLGAVALVLTLFLARWLLRFKNQPAREAQPHRTAGEKK